MYDLRTNTQVYTTLCYNYPKLHLSQNFFKIIETNIQDNYEINFDATLICSNNFYRTLDGSVQLTHERSVDSRNDVKCSNMKIYTNQTDTYILLSFLNIINRHSPMNYEGWNEIYVYKITHQKELLHQVQFELFCHIVHFEYPYIYTSLYKYNLLTKEKQEFSIRHFIFDIPFDVNKSTYTLMFYDKVTFELLTEIKVSYNLNIIPYKNTYVMASNGIVYKMS